MKKRRIIIAVISIIVVAAMVLFDITHGIVLVYCKHPKQGPKIVIRGEIPL